MKSKYETIRFFFHPALSIETFDFLSDRRHRQAHFAQKRHLYSQYGCMHASLLRRWRFFLSLLLLLWPINIVNSICATKWFIANDIHLNSICLFMQCWWWSCAHLKIVFAYEWMCPVLFYHIHCLHNLFGLRVKMHTEKVMHNYSSHWLKDRGMV